MQLNKFTDYGLRLLMYLLQPSDELVTIAEAARALKISENHLVKVTHFMAKQGWLISTRGKGGGIRLAPKALDLPIGEIVRTLEHDQKAINCLEPACVLRFSCGLKSVLDQALEQFYRYLNQYQLRDALHHPVIYSLTKDQNTSAIDIVQIS
ncbi:Rrf2 family transcriptional regulator [Acinetobacter qingfengensis]|uniref:Transcriptional regulator n=1 Tax=Acinetobacter qingfengensis TaxID=1262585 RepID=A0A1E7R1C1_9GAMM|nr:Rrf2 family transcriptional regulator [Acinetobacter qingfengensis]KAA8733269.1 Rrf2 family transcriptional regulator [Acinetobacter qingfengensis]OEY93099.1 transcriptional regulator [Acinetobacter qingfengensis]